MSDGQLRVNASNGMAEVAHGERCVALMVHDEAGAFTGGLVFDPAGARNLAQLLIEQAGYSEEAL